MQNVTNPLVTMYQTQLEASRRLADAFFSGTEKIDRVMIGATRRAITEQLNLAEAMTTVRDPRTAGSTLQAGFFAPNPEGAVNYQKEIMRIVAEMQNEFGRSMQDYIEQIRTSTTATTVKPLENVQSQANDMFNPVSSMFSVWESAFKEVAQLARKNMMVAQGAGADVISGTTQQAGHYAEAAADALHDAAKNAVDTAVNVTTSAREPIVGAEGVTDERRGSHPAGKRK